MENVRRLFKYYLTQPKALFWFILAQVFILIGVIFELMIPVLIPRLVDQGIYGGNYAVVVETALFMIVATVVAVVFYIANARIAAHMAEHAGHDLRLALYRKILSLSFGNLDRFQTSDLLVRLTADVNATKLLIQTSTTTLFRAPLMLIFSTVLIYIISPEIVWVWLVILPLMLLVIIIYVIIGPKYYRVMYSKIDSVNLILQENLAGVRVVKAFVREDYENKRFEEKNNELMKAARASQRVYSLTIIPLILLFLNLGVAGILWFGGVEVVSTAAVTVGDIMSILTFLFLSLIPLVLLAIFIPQLTTGESSLSRIAKVLDAENDI
ncbi:MAG: ABC transporter permease, partial [Candidatus Odinarchaeia archaeon]